MPHVNRKNTLPTADQKAIVASILKERTDLKNARFLGWIVHTPNEDGFLYSIIGLEDSDVLEFGPSPANAHRFVDANDAGDIVRERGYNAVVAALIDTPDAYAVVPVGGNGFSEFTD